jgi:hypothetical protein
VNQQIEPGRGSPQKPSHREWTQQDEADEEARYCDALRREDWAVIQEIQDALHHRMLDAAQTAILSGNPDKQHLTNVKGIIGIESLVLPPRARPRPSTVGVRAARLLHFATTRSTRRIVRPTARPVRAFALGTRTPRTARRASVAASASSDDGPSTGDSEPPSFARILRALPLENLHELAPWRRIAIEAAERVRFHLERERRPMVREFLLGHLAAMERIATRSGRAA